MCTRAVRRRPRSRPAEKRTTAAAWPSSTSARCAAATGARSGRRCANSAPRCPTSTTPTPSGSGRRSRPSSASPPPSTSGTSCRASATWGVRADLSAPVAGLRALMVQALHPLAMAGVDQHSDWRTDPVGRLAATSAYEVMVTFGDQASARRVAARVKTIHERVRGVDTVTGLPYAAGDPALLLWVHAGLVDSGLAASALFGTPLTDADADAYVAQMTVAAELLRVSRDMIPDSVAALDGYV